MRAAIYARVSTDMQRGNFSIPSQVAECQQHARKHNYAIVGDRFIDPETGRDTSSGNGSVPAFVDDYTSRELSRPGLDSALQYLETVGFDVLIVHALDRLARDPYIRQTLEREFIAKGARVEFVLGNYEETPEGEVRKDLDATFAKWENAKRVERSTRGKRRKAESGLYAASQPAYGYRTDKEAPGGLVIFDAEAEVVKLIFRLYVEERYSIREITKTLSSEGIQTYYGGKQWAKSSVRNILLNTIYVGYSFYNTSKQVGKQRVARDRSEWIKISTPSIIDPWMFDQAQKMLEENRLISRTTPSRFYLLSGMVFCAQCNRPYITQTAGAGKNRRVNDAQFYRHRAIEGHCINRTLSARKLEPKVWAEVAAILLEPDKLRRGYYASLEQQEASRARHKDHLASLQKALIKLEQQRQNLTALYIDPDIKLTRDEYIEQKTRIDDQIKAAIKEIEETEAELGNVPVPADFESLEKFAEKVRERLAENYDPAPQDKRHILELLHIKVYLGLDRSIRVDGWFGDDDEQSCDCLLSQPSEHGDYPPQPPPERA